MLQPEVYAVKISGSVGQALSRCLDIQSSFYPDLLSAALYPGKFRLAESTLGTRYEEINLVPLDVSIAQSDSLLFFLHLQYIRLRLTWQNELDIWLRM